MIETKSDKKTITIVYRKSTIVVEKMTNKTIVINR